MKKSFAPDPHSQPLHPPFYTHPDQIAERFDTIFMCPHCPKEVTNDDIGKHVWYAHHLALDHNKKLRRAPLPSREPLPKPRIVVCPRCKKQGKQIELLRKNYRRHVAAVHPKVECTECAARGKRILVDERKLDDHKAECHTMDLSPCPPPKGETPSEVERRARERNAPEMIRSVTRCEVCGLPAPPETRRCRSCSR